MGDMNGICKIDITENGVESNCGSPKNHSNSQIIIDVRSRPLKSGALPQLSHASKHKKGDIVKKILSSVKECYDHKNPNYICEAPIDLLIFKYDNCPACNVHLPVIKKRIAQMKSYGIPITYKVLNVQNEDGLELYKKSGCNGTPCEVRKDFENQNALIHISEGIDQDIGFYTSLFGLSENPIYSNSKDFIPYGIAKKRL